MNRFLALFLMLCSMGCADEQWPPKKMFTAADVPVETASIHPWMGQLLASDVAGAKKHLDARLECNLPELTPLVQTLKDFVPVQIEFSSNVGYIRCVRRYEEKTTRQIAYDAIYIAQPLSNELMESRIAYFDRDVQPLARAFFTRFAGSGEEMEGIAGQFALSYWPSASDFNSRHENSYGDWRKAKLFYAAMNGDSVFIKPNGASAWHTMETDEMIPIADTLEEFIRAYADFRKTHEVFDSWAYRNHQSDRTNR